MDPLLPAAGQGYKHRHFHTLGKEYNVTLAALLCTLFKIFKTNKHFIRLSDPLPPTLFESLQGTRLKITYTPQAQRYRNIVLNRLRRTRTTGIRSTGLICKGPKTLFMFVFGKLCLYLFCFVFFCLYLSFFVFICLYLSLFVFVCLLFVTASCCSTWDLASSSTSTIHRRGLSPPWCEFVF